MSDRLKESVSALMDDEVDTFELRRVLTQLGEQPEAAETWRRYHIQRDILKGDAGVVDLTSGNFDISHAVMDEVDKLPTHDGAGNDLTEAGKPLSRSDRFWKSLASMSAAATVTAVAIFGLQYQNSDSVLAPNTSALAEPMPAVESLTVPSALSKSDFIRANAVASPAVGQAKDVVDSDVIARGLTHYLSQHQFLLQSQEAYWTPSWLPEGFTKVRHERTPMGEVLLYSNGDENFSVSVEALGRQRLPEGTATLNGTVAVTKAADNHFVTVIGQVSLVDAERIASTLVSSKSAIQ
ncbi:MAG: MucB/RseB C-terminal domain-containing protein [Pontibacterium sp.]